MLYVFIIIIREDVETDDLFSKQMEVQFFGGSNLNSHIVINLNYPNNQIYYTYKPLCFIRPNLRIRRCKLFRKNFPDYVIIFHFLLYGNFWPPRKRAEYKKFVKCWCDDYFLISELF